MPFADIYRRQVARLIRLLPLVAEENCFALKGGTAINPQRKFDHLGILIGQSRQRHR